MSNLPPSLSEKGRTRRSQIVEKAIKEFARRGYHATSVADILDGMGIARGTFYQYFANKKAIFDEVVNDLLNKILQEMKAVDPANPTSPPLVQIRDTVSRIFDVLFSEKDMAKVLLSGTTGIDPEFDQKIRSFYSHLHRDVSAFLDVGKQMGLIRNIDSKFFACCIIGTVKEIIYHTIEYGEDCSDISKMADFIIDSTANGIFTKSLST